MYKKPPNFPPKRLPPRSQMTYQMRRPWIFDPSCVLALMPEQGTKWVDYSGKGNNGTMTNATWTDRGRRGKAAYFNGANALVNCGADNSLKITDQQTVAFWFNVSSIAASTILFNNDTTGLVSDMAIGFSTTSDQIYLGSAARALGLNDISDWITTNTWYHWVHVYDMTNDTIRFYLNGEEQTLIAAASSFNTAGTIVSIGARTTGAWTKGLIDEVMIFNKLLTPDEARSLYEMGKP